MSVVKHKTEIIPPEELAPFLEVEAPETFNYERYYVTEEAELMLKDILKMKHLDEEIRSLGIDYLNSTLMYGSPGTGKTTFGKYLAYAMNMDYVYVNFAQLFQGKFGDAASTIKKIFRFLQDKECLFMLDELDSIGIRRGTEAAVTGNELSLTTTSLMQELDNYRRNGCQCILVAATNRIDIMDEALISRFGIRRKIERLNHEHKERYIKKFLNSIKIPFNETNIKDYCRNTPVLPNRNIESDMVRCIVRWIENGKENFSLDHIYEEDSLQET